MRMTVFCCVCSRTLTLDGGKPKSISTDGTVSPTLMVFLPKGPAAAVAHKANATMERCMLRTYALLLTAQVAGSADLRLRSFRAAQTLNARDAAAVSFAPRGARRREPLAKVRVFTRGRGATVCSPQTSKRPPEGVGGPTEASYPRR